MIESVLSAAETLFKGQITLAFKDKTLPINVIQHGGQFGDSEIEKIAISQPSILLTVLNWSRMKTSTQLPGRPYSVTFAAVVAAVGGEPVQRRQQLVVIGLAISKLLEKQRWNLSGDNITAAELVVSRNLYSPAAQRKGMSLWAITWTHEMTSLGDIAQPQLFLLEEVQGDTDLEGSLDTLLEMQSSTMPAHGNLQDIQLD
jgi:hypothetical protein